MIMKKTGSAGDIQKENRGIFIFDDEESVMHVRSKLFCFERPVPKSVRPE
jgi:hypothetical protein